MENKITKLFALFYQEHCLDDNTAVDAEFHKKEYYDLLKGIIIKFNDNNYNSVEDYILYNTDYRKYLLLCLSDDFIIFMNDHGVEYKSSISTNTRLNLKFVEYCKYLQEKRSIEEFYYHFGKNVDNRRPDKDFNLFINEGVDIYGNKVKGENIGYGFRQFVYENYDIPELRGLDLVASVNPIGLALNTTEVFTLLVSVFNELDKNSPYYPIYEKIMKKIYLQLSEKTKGIIDDKIEYDATDISLAFEAEQEWFKEKNHYINETIQYAFKASRDVEITFTQNNKTTTVVGKIISEYPKITIL